MWRSTMLLSATKSVPQMASRISSRVTTRPPRLARRYSRLCSIAAQVDDRIAGTDLAVDDVDLHLAERDHGTIGRSTPVARRPITIARASSSSGEKGTVRMSSTPRSKARSFVRRSPRRVSPRTGVTLRSCVLEAPSRWRSGPLSSWSMSTTARCGRQAARIASASSRLRAPSGPRTARGSASARSGRRPTPVVEDERPSGLVRLCLPRYPLSKARTRLLQAVYHIAFRQSTCHCRVHRSTPCQSSCRPRATDAWCEHGGARRGWCVRDGRREGRGRDQPAAGFSWTAQPLPSGSLKNANEFHGPPGRPSTRRPR